MLMIILFTVILVAVSIIVARYWSGNDKPIQRSRKTIQHSDMYRNVAYVPPTSSNVVSRKLFSTPDQSSTTVSVFNRPAIQQQAITNSLNESSVVHSPQQTRPMSIKEAPLTPLHHNLPQNVQERIADLPIRGTVREITPISGSIMLIDADLDVDMNEIDVNDQSTSSIDEMRGILRSGGAKKRKLEDSEEPSSKKRVIFKDNSETDSKGIKRSRPETDTPIPLEKRFKPSTPEGVARSNGTTSSSPSQETHVDIEDTEMIEDEQHIEEEEPAKDENISMQPEQRSDVIVPGRIPNQAGVRRTRVAFSAPKGVQTTKRILSHIEDIQDRTNMKDRLLRAAAKKILAESKPAEEAKPTLSYADGFHDATPTPVSSTTNTEALFTVPDDKPETKDDTQIPKINFSLETTPFTTQPQTAADKKEDAGFSFTAPDTTTGTPKPLDFKLEPSTPTTKQDSTPQLSTIGFSLTSGQQDAQNVPGTPTTISFPNFSTEGFSKPTPSADPLLNPFAGSFNFEAKPADPIGATPSTPTGQISFNLLSPEAQNPFSNALTNPTTQQLNQFMQNNNNFAQSNPFAAPPQANPFSQQAKPGPRPGKFKVKRR